VLDGWYEVTPDFLARHREDLSAGDRQAYFDGQEPEWRHALAPSGALPRRPAATEGLAKLNAAAGGRPALVLLVGPAGIGKSTAFRQIVCDLATFAGDSGADRRVVVRPPGMGLDLSAVAALPQAPEQSWFLCSDDADEIAADVENAVGQLSEAGRGDVHFLLAARDAEWKDRFVRQGRRLEPDWDRVADLWPALHNRARTLAVRAVASEASAGLAAWAAAATLGEAADAGDIINAWSEAGALGTFAAVAPSERPEALEERATKKLGLSDATLLGASLDLRHGPEGVEKLVRRAVEELGDAKLRSAFFYVAAAEVAGVDGVDLLVIADLIGIGRLEARPAILTPLGRAGLANGSGGAIRPRHRSLAVAAVGLLASGAFDDDLENIFRQLIRGTAATGDDVKGLVAGGAVMNCGQGLAEKLRTIGVTERAEPLACSVADEAEAALPEFLGFSVSRARTYQGARRPDEARRILRDRIADAPTKRDWDVAGRAFLHELGATELGAGDPWATVALAGLALADAEGLGAVSMADAKLALLTLGRASTELTTAPGQTGPLFRRQLRSCTHLGEKVTPKWDQRARFDFHTFKVAADGFEIPSVTAADALIWLAETVDAAIAKMVDAEVANLVASLLPASGELGFTHLEHTIGLGRLPWAKE
jgi:hypothetical protein